MKVLDWFNIRRNRDPHYEGKFLIGSYKMGIFCNVTCPRTPPKDPEDGDLVILRNIYEGFACGLVPCEDCEPDMCSDQIRLNRQVSPIVMHAIVLIENGYLDQHTIKEMAEHLKVSERYLRKLFSEEAGISPSMLATYHRGTIAKKFLSETTMPVTDIAYASGFGSLRQFNQVIRDMYHAPPSSFRKKDPRADSVLYAETGPDFDFRACLRELKQYEIPGVMRITEDSYAGTFKINGMCGYVEVHQEEDENRLCITISAEDKRCYISVYYRILRVFDLITNRDVVREVIGEESYGGYLKHHALPRVPVWFDAYECMLYAVLRQTRTHEEGMRILSLYAEKAGQQVPATVPGVNRIFPDSFDPDAGFRAEFAITNEELDLIRRIETAIGEYQIYLAYNQRYDEFCRSIREIPGIRDRTMNYIAMYGLAMTESFCEEDEINQEIDSSDDYRSYAAMILKDIRNSQMRE